MSDSPNDRIGWCQERFTELADGIEQVIKGKRDVIETAVTCLIAEGHLLIEDVPGTGKTMLARSMARCIDASWKRVQFTPDLLPSDITGIQVYNENTRKFDFHPGPVFANIILADEINRASPKTQSALLEVMEERQVTIDAEAHKVPRPFIVLATQNPVDLDGTYRLPEAQLDRFLMRVSMGYPDLGSEREILSGQLTSSPIDDLEPVSSVEHLRTMISIARREVYVAPGLQDYIIQPATATRDTAELRLGVSSRGCLALQRACQAFAAASGRDYVIPEDVKRLATPTLAHRLILTPEVELRGRTGEQILNEILESVPLPAASANA